MTLKISRLIIPLALVVSVGSVSLAGEEPREKGVSPLLQMLRCDRAEDCVEAPRVYRECFHYCRDQECTSAKPCSFFNRHFQNFPSCFTNIPCRPVPGEPRCIAHQCEAPE